MPVPRRLLLGALAAVLAGAPLAVPSAASGPVLTSATPAGTPELGYDRIGVLRGDTWYLRDSLQGGPSQTRRERVHGWAPLALDTDADGADSLGVFRDGVWLLDGQDDRLPDVVHFGHAGDQPVVGDWDGNGTDTLAVFRAGQWLFRSNDPLAAPRAITFGMPGDRAVVGDWDGDGDTDIGVRRGPRWFLRDASTAGRASRSFDWGRPTDVPVIGDWDHDGRDDVGLFRAGTWFFRPRSPVTPMQSTRFGLPGDLPIVRRLPGLAPGVQHRVLRNSAVPYTAHVVIVDLAANAQPDTVLAQDRLRGLEVLSSMSRRTRAVVAINGDYALSNGRPVHLFADDGVLAQTPQLRGRALAFDTTGRRVFMGFPDLKTAVSTGPRTAELRQLNAGAPSGPHLAGWTAAGTGLGAPPRDHCYAGVTPTGARTVDARGSVRTPLKVTGVRCGGPSPVVPSSGAMLGAKPDLPGSAFLRTLRKGQALQLSTQLGFPGAVDAVGGNPMLVTRRRIAAGDVDGSGSFFGRNPRTAVGLRRDGRLILVVIDGRQGSYSRGATLRETAELMHALGAVEAVNLDGGGSSEMLVNGVIVNRPSDGRERPVSSALTILRRSGSGPASAPAGTPAPAVTGSASALDPASTGGLLDALRRDGVPLPADLAAVADQFAAAHR